MTETTTFGSRDRNETERTCDYPGCDDPTTLRDGRGSRYCAHDHWLAAANDKEPSDLTEYEVEYDGVSGTFREESQEKADLQWKHVVLSRRKP